MILSEFEELVDKNITFAHLSSTILKKSYENSLAYITRIIIKIAIIYILIFYQPNSKDSYDVYVIFYYFVFF